MPFAAFFSSHITRREQQPRHFDSARFASGYLLTLNVTFTLKRHTYTNTPCPSLPQRSPLRPSPRLSWLRPARPSRRSSSSTPRTATEGRGAATALPRSRTLRRSLAAVKRPSGSFTRGCPMSELNLHPRHLCAPSPFFVCSSRMNNDQFFSHIDISSVGNHSLKKGPMKMTSFFFFCANNSYFMTDGEQRRTRGDRRRST